MTSLLQRALSPLLSPVSNLFPLSSLFFHLFSHTHSTWHHPTAIFNSLTAPHTLKIATSYHSQTRSSSSCPLPHLLGGPASRIAHAGGRDSTRESMANWSEGALESAHGRGGHRVTGGTHRGSGRVSGYVLSGGAGKLICSYFVLWSCEVCTHTNGVLVTSFEWSDSVGEWLGGYPLVCRPFFANPLQFWQIWKAS